MKIHPLTMISILSFLAACGGTGQSGDDGSSTHSDGSAFENVGGVLGSGSFVAVEGVALKSANSAQNGQVNFYNPTEIGGTSVTPTGAFAGSSEIVFAIDPLVVTDEMLLGVSSSLQHTTNLNAISATFTGSYAQTTSGTYTSQTSGEVTMIFELDQGSMELYCGECAADGADMTWGMVDLDGTKVQGFSQSYENGNNSGYIGAIVFGGEEVVGAYGGYRDGLGITGTFGAVAD